MLHDHAVGVMESNGAVVTPIDLKALDLPLYNPELEGESFPSNAQTFKDKLMEAGKRANIHAAAPFFQTKDKSEFSAFFASSYPRLHVSMSCGPKTTQTVFLLHRPNTMA